ncbi:MAG: acylphosphatase [Deltaproteobacteria bacterium]|nr:acylphosphatase [Deltaproteobacteria bacterium]
MGDKVRKRMVITGRVQGVFFRASTRDTARRHGVTGWVENRPDGAVEAVLEGDEEDVDAVLSWVKNGGPPSARVENVRVSEEPYKGGFSGFDVRYS